MATGFVLGLLVGLVVAAGAAIWLWRWWSGEEREREVARQANLDRAHERQLDDAGDAMRDAFRALSAEGMARLEARLAELETRRVRADAQLSGEVQRLVGASARVADEAAALGRALRTPVARGRWGELQLRRVVELAGLAEHVDFATQVVIAPGPGQGEVSVGAGAGARPDMVLRLPGGRIIAVDAKAPLDAYLAAIAATDDSTRHERLVAHARAVRRHARGLAQRGYARALGARLDLVIMFLPAEAALAAALEVEPELLAALVGERVVVATPATLLALLHAVAAGWREATAAAHAAEAAALGRELFERLRGLTSHFEALRRGLAGAADAYDRAAATLERRVLVSARRLGGLGMTDGNGLDPPALLSDGAEAAATASSWTDTSR